MKNLSLLSPENETIQAPGNDTAYSFGMKNA